MMNRIISKQNIFILLLLVICLSFFAMKNTYAKFSNNYSTDDEIVNYHYSQETRIMDFSLDSFGFDEIGATLDVYELVKVKAKGYTVFNIDITNELDRKAYYGLWYEYLDNFDYDGVSIGKLESSYNEATGDLNSGEVKTVTLIAINNNTKDVSLKIGLNSSEVSVQDIDYYDGKNSIDDVLTRPNSDKVNSPNLDVGMIPVTYDYKSGNWIKASKANKNGSWYDYSDKRWANVVLVKDNVRGNYISAKVGTTVNMSDILAFYVWIPRFKYRVWDINRQVSDEKKYSYDAFGNGIDIQFEIDAKSSGNVKCSYNYNVVEDNYSLSDECKYNDKVIATDGSNDDYKGAWYTHPAFTLDGEELTGFWIGKFETTGSEEVPTVLPDSISLVNKDISTFFNIANKINSYGIYTNVRARVLTNLEWGAVSYLSYSLYGICDNDSCGAIKANNSMMHYTGRSSGSGTIIDDDNSQMGNYTYDGYIISSGVKTSNKDLTAISSSNGNITGVYDMAGGAWEYVMSNVLSSDKKMNMSDSSSNWGDDLNNFHFTGYSSGSNSNQLKGYNRSRLGDAISEVTIGYDNEYSAWMPGDGISGGNSSFSISTIPWLIRGGSTNPGASIFSYNYSSGRASGDCTFRTVLS